MLNSPTTRHDIRRVTEDFQQNDSFPQTSFNRFLLLAGFLVQSAFFISQGICLSQNDNTLYMIKQILI